MIYGKGLVYNRLIEYSLNPDVCVISDALNSRSTDEDFRREKNQLLKILKENAGKKIVYISSTRINDPLEQNSAYVVHRKESEAAVARCPSYLIVRLPQILGSCEEKDTLPELKAKMTAASFQIQRISYYNTFLFPLALVVRLSQKFRKSGSTTDLDIPARPVNVLLKRIFLMERFFLNRNVCFPFGVSVIAVGSKQ